MLCGQSSLVNHHDDGVVAISLRCRAWTCEHCREERHRQLIRLAIVGSPNRFITLTVNPRLGTGPVDRAKRLADAWRKAAKRITRLHGGIAPQYLAVFEKTKRGEPHLHILARCKYINQRWLSEVMRELTNSPIVDIRKVTEPRTAARYIAKYVGKAPHKFDTCKRYWHTRDWDTTPEPEEPPIEWKGGGWGIEDCPLSDLFEFWKAQNMNPVMLNGNIAWWGKPPPWAADRDRAAEIADALGEIGRPRHGAAAAQNRRTRAERNPSTDGLAVTSAALQPLGSAS